MEVDPPPSSSRNTRLSSKVKTAKEKEHTTSTSTKRTRSTTRTESDPKGKRKASPDTRQSKKARKPTSSSLTINEPSPDLKGKRRASDLDAESDTGSPSTKRTYSLRPRKSTTTIEMPKKTNRSITKGKGSLTTEKILSLPGSSTRHLEHEDDDIEMMDVDEGSDEEGHSDGNMPPGDVDENEDEDDNDGENGDMNGGGAMHGPRDDDTAAALAMFGDYRSLGSYMVTLSNRLKTMLNNIKMTADPTTRLVALQELSEILSISTEDTLSGYFEIDSFVKELLKIMGGTGGEAARDEERDGEGDVQDEDTALAAAIGMTTGPGDENLEAQVLACRCLANLMEAMPGSAHTVVYHGAVPVLCSKLIEISYIDLAEQTLSTLEKISEEYPSAIVREGGLSALLNYLDFFSIIVQRTALQAASNCCRNISSDSYPMIKEVFPIVRNVLSYSDQRLVEFACLCVIRTIESYHRTAPEHLESLLNTDLIKAIHALLLPAGGSPLISSSTFTLFLRALGTAAKCSPKIAIALLEADVVDILYQILTGVLPPQKDSHREEGDASGGQGYGGGVADMAVMQNLAHRAKDQVEEALSLISELMPPLPKDSVFDHKSYTEKALSRLAKARAKAERTSHRIAALTPGPSAASTPPPTDETATQASDVVSVAGSVSVPQQAEPAIEVTPAPLSRSELLRQKMPLVNHVSRLLVPVLVDVYAASVVSHVRTKAMTGLLKAVSFLDGDDLRNALKFVPVASFVGSILSSREPSPLAIGALQLVELLLMKSPSEYRPSFRREGVLYEIDTIAEQKLIASKPKEPEPAPQASNTDVSGAIPQAASLQAPKRSSSHTLDPQDAMTLRARIVRFKYLSGAVEAEDAVFATLRDLSSQLSSPDATEAQLRICLRAIAEKFGSANISISSFELFQSGLADSLLDFATAERRLLDTKRRQELLFQTLTERSTSGTRSPDSQTPLAVLVKKLQESLTRMESFEVVTVSNSLDESKRNSASMLARQLRLRLVADEDSDIPRTCSNIIVSIHAIATFQALNDYLRPRVSGLLGNLGGSRLSGMLAALAASGISPSALARSAGASSSAQEPIRAGPAAASTSQTAVSASAPVPTPTTHPANAGGEETQGRRRSLRLSAKASGNASGTSAPAGNAPTLLSPPEPAASETLVNEDDTMNEDFVDDDFEAEVFEDDVEGDSSLNETTVTLNVADDGSKVEAQTPDGTRIATPNAAKDPPAMPAAALKTSYAAALKAKPTDWHLQFSIDNHLLPLDLTIYGAMYQQEARNAKAANQPLNPNSIWSGLYTVKFKKVPGPAPVTDSDNLTRDRPSSPVLSSLPTDASHTKILRLLRVLHRLSIIEQDRYVADTSDPIPGPSNFVNNKLTAKLTRQLEEPMIVASSCLPEWTLELPQHFPFLFPFSTRYAFLQSTSFGYARLILKWQSQQSRNRESSRRDDTFGFLGRLQRQKVRISRKHMLESAVKVFELYGSSSSVLEVEYFEEVGTGLGPTLEFYSIVSKEFARRDLKLWRDADSTIPGPYVHHPQGLFPAPMGAADLAADRGVKRLHLFQVVGQFVAKALLDSRIIDLTMNKLFIKMILGDSVPQTISSVELVDPGLAKSLAKLLAFVDTRRALAADVVLSSDGEKLGITSSSDLEGSLEDLALDFTVPGYDVELKPNGRDVAVTIDNVEEYIEAVIESIVGKGVQAQAQAFREGFSKVFPVDDLKIFTPDELSMLFGNAEEDWSVETLGESLKADHGFNVESKAIHDLIEVMANYDKATRRDYLQFITGSPKLPIGGFRGLNPPFTVVRKPHEAPLSADDYLPSVMTCVNYLKLPEYTSKAVMQEKLLKAMKEGVGSFHLS